jgi:hypothetical protein
MDVTQGFASAVKLCHFETLLGHIKTSRFSEINGAVDDEEGSIFCIEKLLIRKWNVSGFLAVFP